MVSEQVPTVSKVPAASPIKEESIPIDYNKRREIIESEITELMEDDQPTHALIAAIKVMYDHGIFCGIVDLVSLKVCKQLTHRNRDRHEE